MLHLNTLEYIPALRCLVTHFISYFIWVWRFLEAQLNNTTQSHGGSCVFLRLTCVILLRVPLQSPQHEVILYTLVFKAANNKIPHPARMYKEFLQFNSSESFQVYYRAWKSNETRVLCTHISRLPSYVVCFPLPEASGQPDAQLGEVMRSLSRAASSQTLPWREKGQHPPAKFCSPSSFCLVSEC